MNNTTCSFLQSWLTIWMYLSCSYDMSHVITFDICREVRIMIYYEINRYVRNIPPHNSLCAWGVKTDFLSTSITSSKTCFVIPVHSIVFTKTFPFFLHLLYFWLVVRGFYVNRRTEMTHFYILLQRIRFIWLAIPIFSLCYWPDLGQN